MNFDESIDLYDQESFTNIKKMETDTYLQKLSQDWIDRSLQHRYVFNWKWLGKPIIQHPSDVVATQEIIFQTKPTMIIETGIARGGSIIFNASQLALLDIEKESKFDVLKSKRKVIGVDIDIRNHNREAIESDNLSPMISLVEGSSIDDTVIKKVENQIDKDDRVMVILDSDHTHEHVLRELEAYSSFVSEGCFLIVQDTGIEFAPQENFDKKSWSKGNSPLTAMDDFLRKNDKFERVENINSKLLITSSPKGYLRRKL